MFACVFHSEIDGDDDGKQSEEVEIGVDPFAYVTIASACMASLKHKFLVRDEIAYFDRSVTNHSKVSIRWLEYVMFRDGAAIKHARNGGESHIGGYRVDGYDPATRTVYEFNGCYWHGCQKCFPRRKKQFKAQKAKEEALRKQGYTAVAMWECDFKNLERDSVHCHDFLAANSFFWHEPLEPRDSFFGGRTNAARLYFKCASDESIEYVDFTSLYPWVNKNGEYPVGHPDIILNPSVDRLYNREFFGLIKCEVVPPRGLFHPVLAEHAHGKLMFPLCHSCMDQSSTTCHHSPDERALVGTWCTPEVYKAMDMGYEVRKISEVHHFAQTKVGLFADYVNTFLKKKQEASGWPPVGFGFCCYLISL